MTTVEKITQDLKEIIKKRVEVSNRIFLSIAKFKCLSVYRSLKVAKTST